MRSSCRRRLRRSPCGRLPWPAPTVGGRSASPLPEPDGATLLEADVTAGRSCPAARLRWRQLVWAAVLVVAALTVLFCAAPFIERRRAARDMRAFAFATAALVALLVAARFILYFALLPFSPTGVPTPLDLLLTTLTMTRAGVGGRRSHRAAARGAASSAHASAGAQRRGCSSPWRSWSPGSPTSCCCGATSVCC